MLKRSFKYALMVILFTSLYSCASMGELELLDASTRSYERAIRWGEFTRAKSFHKNDSELQDLERRRLKLYRVTGYNVINSETPDKNNSYALVEIKYYKNDSSIIKALSIRQHWKRDEGTKLWYLDSAFPDFR